MARKGVAFFRTVQSLRGALGGGALLDGLHEFTLARNRDN